MENQIGFTVMGREGDTKHIFNKNNPVEVEAARTLFNKLRGSGYLAYKVTVADGSRGVELKEFDPNEEKMIFSPAIAGG